MQGALDAKNRRNSISGLEAEFRAIISVVLP